MIDEYVEYKNSRILIHAKSVCDDLRPDEIKRLNLCHMEDEVHHGSELFHILELEDSFWLIGPFVVGAGAAMAELLSAYPEIPSRNVRLANIPYRYRKSSWLGLRLFPVAGFQKYSRDNLTELNLLVESKSV